MNNENKKCVAISVINITNTRHYLVRQDSQYLYLNEEVGQLVNPPNDLSVISNKGKSLTYLRKQYLLRFLVDYLNNYYVDNMDDVKSIVQGFRDYINEPFINAFLYWPYLNKEDFKYQMISILRELKKEIDHIYKPVQLAQDGITKIAKDCKGESKYMIDDDDDDECVKDPSYR